ncbi:metallophosphoesterase family protein [Pseudomonas sp. 6D_7.1_Bac1]|uniref:metallophosphoesterase family protein n=1 Tax=Pseudomonas sp. 6D_7.1_Bac1 TaxID=2971615 RepID=UPI0021C98DAD|nr:metallophosphoesterase [Pseudomonas sp. 6D_7.1_Bac1]MCU1751531.1 metallophosphoesterase [Pseudomonas sp. 6D_7.1_Bac1]
MKLIDGFKFVTCLVFLSAMPVAHSNAAHYSPMHMVFTSDPQYPWTEKSDDEAPQSDSERDARSQWLIETQYADVADFRKNFGGAGRVPVMINGDITAFGHGWQRSVVKPILDAKLGGVYDYGLGNHDYENNIDDCFLNSCAAGSVVELKERYWGKLDNVDLTIQENGGIKKIWNGSLAYARDHGDVHLVQLHNEPTYSVSFTAWDWGAPTGYNIGDSLDWLERDLKSARDQGKIIILNMHKPDRWKGTDGQIARFKKMIQDYKVTAVFAGHYHEDSGEYFGWNKRDYFGDVPVFLSGGASQQTYLITSFSADRRSLTVSRVQGNNWPSRKVISTIPVK